MAANSNRKTSSGTAGQSAAADPKYKALSPKERRQIGSSAYRWSFEEEANRKLWLAQCWSPRLVSACYLMAAVSVLACLGSVLGVYNRPEPLALLSFPDGSIHCALPSLDMKTGRAKARTAADQRLCAQYEPPPPLTSSAPIHVPGVGGLPDDAQAIPPVPGLPSSGE